MFLRIQLLIQLRPSKSCTLLKKFFEQYKNRRNGSCGGWRYVHSGYSGDRKNFMFVYQMLLLNSFVFLGYDLENNCCQENQTLYDLDDILVNTQERQTKVDNVDQGGTYDHADY